MGTTININRVATKRLEMWTDLKLTGFGNKLLRQSAVTILPNYGSFGNIPETTSLQNLIKIKAWSKEHLIKFRLVNVLKENSG